MSEILQAGQHPDADQLNAFVEHTLPAHEQQQTLAHLAICPACRQIVALSLPPADESPVLRSSCSPSLVSPVASRLGGDSRVCCSHPGNSFRSQWRKEGSPGVRASPGS